MRHSNKKKELGTIFDEQNFIIADFIGPAFVCSKNIQMKAGLNVSIGRPKTASFLTKYSDLFKIAVLERSNVFIFELQMLSTTRHQLKCLCSFVKTYSSRQINVQPIG